jgi:hypothetical protein
MNPKFTVQAFILCALLIPYASFAGQEPSLQAGTEDSANPEHPDTADSPLTLHPQGVPHSVLPVHSQAKRGPLVAIAELGSLAVFSHKIQFGNDGSYFNLRNDGGQDNLYFNIKLALDLKLGKRHHLIALYQPLEIISQEVLREDLVVDEVTFPQGTPMEFQYGFPFYRLSYVYDLITTDERRLGLGGSLQIRNANIAFRSINGELLRTSRDIGPVPLVKAVWEQHLSSTWWYGAEVDGIYAPVSYLNGSDTEITGALIDANVRIGRPFHELADIYLNLRYLAGGAVGTSDEPAPRDGYVRNWLHFGILGIGFRLNP